MEKKVSTVVAILWIMFLLLVDIIDFFLTLIGVGLVANSLINIPVAGFIQFWLYKEGIKGIASLAGSLIEFIPVINMLPIRTATMMVTIYIANRPVISKVVDIKDRVKSVGAGAKNFRANMKEKGFGGALKDELRGKTPSTSDSQAPVSLQPTMVTVNIPRRITPSAS